MTDNELHSASRIRQIVSLIDLTNLADDCDTAAIQTLCDQTNTPAGHVAAVCVWPAFVADAKTHLGSESPVKIATVVNFPSGNEPVNTTCRQIETAINDGANEIDYVIAYAELMKGNFDTVSSGLNTVRSHTPNAVKLKVILETGALESGDLIRTAANMALDHGADFIKTSTGKVPVNATSDAATIMLDAIAQSNSDAGFKAAGGIKTIDDANLYLTLAEDRLGRDWADAAHFRFGASGLLQDVLSYAGTKPSTPAGDNSDY